MTAVLALSFATATVAVCFAQDAPKKEEKKKSKKKKKGEETKKS
jgi:hypothetical protein